MDKYSFKTSKKARKYCNEIVDEMVRQFNIPYQEAVGRVNKKWSHRSYISSDSMFFHMLPEEWAREVYYEPGSYWWEKDKKDLIPLPYEDE